MDKFKEITKSQYFPFIVLFFIMLFLHLFMVPDIIDDEHFKKALVDRNLIEWLDLRYTTWSSRLIIEVLLVGFLTIGFVVWKIINSLVMVLLAYSISKLFVKDNFLKNNWLIVLWIMIIPLQIISSAGWVTSSLNYLWPLSFGIYSLIFIKRELANEKISTRDYILYILAIIYAANHEQMVIILLAIYFIYLVYCLIKKNVSIFLFIVVIVVLSSLLFIMTCPGNYVRYEANVGGSYIDFNMLSLIDKVVLGINSTMAHFMLRHSILCTLISGIMATLIYKTYSKILYRIIGAIPFISCLLFSIFWNVLYVVKFIDGDFMDLYNRSFLINVNNFYNPLSYIPLVIYLLVIGTLIISLYLIFKHTYKSLIAIFILLIGLASRIIMGFSPTVFISSYRPDIFMAFSLILCGFLISKEIKGADKDIYYKVICGIALLSLFLNTTFVINYWG